MRRMQNEPVEASMASIRILGPRFKVIVISKDEMNERISQEM